MLLEPRNRRQIRPIKIKVNNHSSHSETRTTSRVVAEHSPFMRTNVQRTTFLKIIILHIAITLTYFSLIIFPIFFCKAASPVAHLFNAHQNRCFLWNSSTLHENEMNVDWDSLESQKGMCCVCVWVCGWVGGWAAAVNVVYRFILPICLLLSSFIN